MSAPQDSGPQNTVQPFDVPEPDGVLVTRWAADPFSLGSYTYLGLSASRDDRSALEGRVGQGLYFAGEAGAVGHAGTVHGAYLSGQRAAQALMNDAAGGEYAGSERTVLVLGAGMAGLSAATALRGAGWQVRVVEGRDRIGGRILTDDTLGFPVDLGASWVHGETGNPVAELLAELHVPLLPTPGETGPRQVFRPGGQPLSPAEIGRGEVAAERLLTALRVRRDAAQQSLSRLPIRAAADEILAGLNLSEFERLYAELSLSMAYELSTSCADLPLWAGNEPYAFPGSDLIPQGGYGQLVRHLARDLEIVLGQRVRWVRWAGNGCALDTETGTHTAAAIVSTLPLGVLKSGEVAFDPVLPGRVLGATLRLGMGVLDKVVLRFPFKFWPGESFTVLDGQPRSHGYWLDLSAHVGAPTLVRFIYAPEALALERLSDEELVQGSLSLLRSLGGVTGPD